MDQPSPLGTNGKALNKLVHFRLTRKTFFVGLYFLLPALGVASVIQLAFVAEGGIKRGPPKDDSIGSSTWTEPKNISITLPDYPDHVFAGQSGLKLSSAASSLGSTALIAILAWFASRTGPVQTTYRRRTVVVALLGVNALMALATFLYAFVAHGLSAHFDPEYAMSLVDPRVIYAYGQGTFDLETWACETKDLPHYDEYPAGKVHTLCALEAGARWMTLFVFLAATGLFTLACLDWRGEKFLLTTWKNKRVSWRLDYV